MSAITNLMPDTKIKTYVQSLIIIATILLSGCTHTSPNVNRSTSNIDEIRSVSQEISLQVSEELRKIFPESPKRPVVVSLDDPSNHDPRYPAFWSVKSVIKGVNKVSLVNEFTFLDTWWNFEPGNEGLQVFLDGLTLRQQLLIIISHELTHIFMHPTSFRGWFQEVIATNIGLYVANRIDPSISAYGDYITTRTPTLEELTTWDYKSIFPPNIENCREFQVKSYLYGKQYPIDELALWVKQLKKHFPNDYNLFEDVMSATAEMKHEHDQLILRYKPN